MHEASLLTMFNSHRGWLRFLRMPFGAKMSQDMFQLWMDAILEQCPGVKGIHDDMVIFGVDQQDHDANLINLLNVCQKEGLVLNSNKLELQREQVTFFGAEYSAQGMHPDPKGSRDHRNDSANEQAATSVFSRYGKLHGDCRGITRIHRSPSRPSHSYGRQPHSLIFMSTLYKATCCLPASS